jgi:hypothetical protein
MRGACAWDTGADARRPHPTVCRENALMRREEVLRVAGSSFGRALRFTVPDGAELMREARPRRASSTPRVPHGPAPRAPLAPGVA